MKFDAVLIPPRRAESISKGFWHDRTINDDLKSCIKICPDKLALKAVRSEDGVITQFTYSEPVSYTHLTLPTKRIV